MSAEFDVHTGLRTCAGVGEMRLAWDRSDRWRMDESSPRRESVLLSYLPTPRSGAGSMQGVALTRCVAAEKLGPFAALVEAPARILDELGRGRCGDGDGSGATDDRRHPFRMFPRHGRPG